MRRQLKNGIFYLIIILQMLWWIKMFFTYGTLNRRHEYYEQTPMVSTGSESEEMSQTQVKQETIDSLKFHIQKVKELLHQDNTTDETNNTMSKEAVFRKYYNKLVRHTILPRSASVVLTGNYLKGQITLCSRHRELDLLIIVHTAPYHFSRRAMIRRSLSNNNLVPPYTIQPAFFIGVMPEDKREPSKEDLLEKEFLEHGDLVQKAFNEDFRNLSLKAVLWLKWTEEYCLNADMILKIDDDVVLDVYKVLPLARGLLSKYKRSIFCNVNKQGTQPIPRTGRTQVDYREFMDVPIYPYTYCSGFVVFLTPDLIPLFSETIHKIPLYNVDDVFMFGMVPKFTGQITYHNLGYNLSIWHHKVYNCTIENGSQCRYFGTMAEDENQREKVWQAMKKSHERDFHFPKLLLP